ncbi:type II toxin-antitoxin system RelE/ParE family toxin [Rugamonas sp. CCM 8940]|uniref:type II toxin-antitoxin system RelE/ParE family toxin n=1 Tax=Rugamonas sp. CCM 8940 TaxID=2765359 RepID=UPI0018F36D2E|nr:type II toxin-antitoxin system RelE/ParE family toxin [Rugamonas sp. CCM 8940]MBJ7310335.1 type II toxin-antitoxin system RelE/ParE family toxin [Rugamonas sp. CCM 8940]
MILNFRDKMTALVWNGTLVHGLPVTVQNVARRKLRMLNSALLLGDLRAPPGNRLEALKGARKGQYSIRINQQWRICFLWQDGDCAEVEIVDYH